MADEEKKDLVPEDELDKTVELIPIDDKELETAIIQANTKAELEKQFNLFNMAQSKKNALRIMKLNSLLDKVEDQAIARFEKRPDQVSNREILDYMQVVANQIERSQKVIDNLDQKPLIKVTNNKTEVNIVSAAPTLDREGKERVVDAIKALLGQLNAQDDQRAMDIQVQPESEEDGVMPSDIITDSLNDEE